MCQMAVMARQLNQIDQFWELFGGKLVLILCFIANQFEKKGEGDVHMAKKIVNYCEKVVEGFTNSIACKCGVEEVRSFWQMRALQWKVNWQGVEKQNIVTLARFSEGMMDEFEKVGKESGKCKDWRMVMLNTYALKECDHRKCKRKDVVLRMCGRCKAVFYCSRKHQKKDWKRHKDDCYPCE